jgi:hypothetical protein
LDHADRIEPGPVVGFANPLEIAQGPVAARLHTPMAALVGFVEIHGHVFIVLGIGVDEYLLDLFGQLALIAFERQDVIPILSDDLLRDLLLATYGVDGHDATFEPEKPDYISVC